MRSTSARWPSRRMTASSPTGASTVFQADGRSRRCAAILRRISASDRSAVAMNVTVWNRPASDCAYRLFPLRTPPNTNVIVRVGVMRHGSSEGVDQRRRHQAGATVPRRGISSRAAVERGHTRARGPLTDLPGGNENQKRATTGRSSTLPSRSTEPMAASGRSPDSCVNRCELPSQRRSPVANCSNPRHSQWRGRAGISPASQYTRLVACT